MDLLYYWNDIEEDLAAGRIGYFESDREKLAKFAEGPPDYIWVCKTPEGQKGYLQLRARLFWTPAPPATVTVPRGHYHIFYDAKDPTSVSFPNSGTGANIQSLTAWMKKHFQKSIRGTFQGASGQLELRGDMLTELKRIAGGFITEPFTAYLKP